MAKEFFSTTLNGVELKCKFAFPKIYFTKNPEDRDLKIYYDIGFLAEIGWQESNSATPQFSLNMINAKDITAGMSIIEGEIAFKTFHHDSLALLKKEIMKGINGGADKITFPIIEDNPFLTLEDSDASLIFDTHEDPERINWSQIPLFDIILTSQASNGTNNQKEIRIKTIKGVKINSTGFAESIESLELNTFSSFIAIGGQTDWEVAFSE